MIKRLVSSAFAVLCILVLAIGFCPAYLVAQAQPKMLTHPDVNLPIRFDVSPPLRDMATQATTQRGGEVEHPVLYPKLQQLMQAAKQGKSPSPTGLFKRLLSPLSAHPLA